MKTGFLALLLASLLASSPALAGETVKYMDGETELEGYWAPAQCDGKTPAPVVLIVHQWMGLGDYEKMRADQVAQNCYNAFAIDMYGKGVRPQTQEEAGKELAKYKSDTPLARQRLTAALDYARSRKDADTGRIAAMGYCFGGGMVLELARSGADIKGAVSFHGVLSTTQPAQPGGIKAAVQVHHGAEDPFVPQEQVQAFVAEMKTAKADWSLTQYANAVHAFTQKGAGDDPSKGAAYNAKADQRSWAAAMAFLTEVFAR